MKQSSKINISSVKGNDKNQIKNQIKEKTMKNYRKWQKSLNIVLVYLIFSVFFWIFMAGTTPAETITDKTPNNSFQKILLCLNQTSEGPKTKDIGKPVAAGQILSLEIKTDPNYEWLYEFKLKNNGLSPINMREARMKAIQILDNNQEIITNEISYPQLIISPGAISSGLEPMYRCSKTKKFRLEWWYQGVKLDSKTVDLPNMNIHIVGAKKEFSRGGNSWNAKIKNFTGHNLKITVRPFTMKGEPLGTGSQKLMPPNSEVEFMGNLTSENLQLPIEVRAIYINNLRICPGIEDVILDKWVIVPSDVFIEYLSWDNPSKTWNIRVKNNRNTNVNVRVVSMFLVQGRVIHDKTNYYNTFISPGAGYNLSNAYPINTPLFPGTQLKIQILLQPSNELLDEKIIMLTDKIN